MRRKPYTENGLRRVPCARCKKPSHHQWNVCADAFPFQNWRGVCSSCDIALNRMVLEWMGDPDVDVKMDAYEGSMTMKRMLEASP